MQTLQVRTRLDAELLAEPPSYGLVAGKCFGLPAVGREAEQQASLKGLKVQNLHAALDTKAVNDFMLLTYPLQQKEVQKSHAALDPKLLMLSCC